MRALHRAVRRGTGGGRPLPTVFPSLAASQIILRQSEVTLVAAQPGAGKSTFALAYALRSQVPTLYMSADTGARTQALRIISAATGRPQTEVEPLIAAEPEWTGDMLRQHSRHIRWAFDSAPSLQDIEDNILAFNEMNGTPPTLLVLDNFSDIVSGGDEWGGMRSLMKDIKFWAREYDMAVLALHHTSENEKGDPCPPRSAIHGKISQVPALVLTLASAEGWMALAPVKNRYGPADPSGETAVYLSYSAATMQVADLSDAEVVA